METKKTKVEDQKQSEDFNLTECATHPVVISGGNNNNNSNVSSSTISLLNNANPDPKTKELLTPKLQDIEDLGIRKLCVCGKSKKMPLCDWSHRGENWVCGEADKNSFCRYAFITSSAFRNLGTKLGATFAGLDLWNSDCPKSAEYLVAVIGDNNFEYAVFLQKAISSKHFIFVNVLGEMGKHLWQHTFDRVGWFFDLSEHATDMFTVFNQIVQYLKQVQDKKPWQISPLHRNSSPLSSAFLSHAVKDEKIIEPAVQHIRNFFNGDLFLCADSIEIGTNWYESIELNLKGQHLFICLISEAYKKSHFCSFEGGVALGLKKKIYLISLDGSLPPPFFSHIQCAVIPRIQEAKPFLDQQDILVQEILKCLVEG